MNCSSKFDSQNEKTEDPPDPNRNSQTNQRPLLNAGEERGTLFRRMLVALVLAAAGAVGTWFASKACKYCDSCFEITQMNSYSNLNPVFDMIIQSK